MHGTLIENCYGLWRAPGSPGGTLLNSGRLLPLARICGWPREPLLRRGRERLTRLHLLIVRQESRSSSIQRFLSQPLAQHRVLKALEWVSQPPHLTRRWARRASGQQNKQDKVRRSQMLNLAEVSAARGPRTPLPGDLPCQGRVRPRLRRDLQLRRNPLNLDAPRMGLVFQKCLRLRHSFWDQIPECRVGRIGSMSLAP